VTLYYEHYQRIKTNVISLQSYWQTRRTQTIIACLVHQSLASFAPTYLTTDIHLVSEYGRRPLRSSTDRTLTVPQTHNRFGDRSVAVAGPRLWNSLPISLRQISSFGQFRRYLKNHLFGIWEITAQCDAWFSALYNYSYLLTYLHLVTACTIATVPLSFTPSLITLILFTMNSLSLNYPVSSRSRTLLLVLSLKLLSPVISLSSYTLSSLAQNHWKHRIQAPLTYLQSSHNYPTSIPS